MRIVLVSGTGHIGRFRQAHLTDHEVVVIGRSGGLDE